MLSGFYAGSQASGGFITPQTGTTAGAAGEGTASWKSQDVYAKATLLDIGKGSRHRSVLSDHGRARRGGNTVVRSDLVQQVFLDSQLAIVRDRDSDALNSVRRAVVRFQVRRSSKRSSRSPCGPGIENVTTPFQIGNRINVPNGQFNVLGTQFDVTGPPNRTFVYGIHYNGGDLYGGTRRAPGGMVDSTSAGSRRASTTRSTSSIFRRRRNRRRELYGHDLSVSSTFSYSALARTTLVLEGDTVAGRGTALLTTTLQFGQLSALTLSIRGAVVRRSRCRC